MPEPKKTLEQITQDAISSNFGLSNEDLALLFEDDTGTEPAADADTTDATPPVPAEPPTQPATDVGDTSTPVVSTVTTPVPPPEPAKVVDISSLERKIEQMNTVVQELMRRNLNQSPTSPVSPVSTNTADDVDDQQIITKPKESIMKMMMGTLKTVLPAAFAEYDMAVQKRIFVDSFRAQHADFDELRPLMRQIIAENPANDEVYALPRVYEEAKRRKAAELEALKRELIPTIPQAPANPTISDDVLAKLEQRLADRVRKRRAVSGTLTSDQTTPVTPIERQTPTPKEKPLTEEEKMFLEMLNSGPPSSRFLKGLELAANK